jgi:hypothetical protein
MSTLAQVPARFVAGETVVWTTCPGEYKPADGWVLTHYFRGVDHLDVVAVASGESFESTITATASALLAPGQYGWQAWVELNGVKVAVDNGSVGVEQGYAEITDPLDTRSNAKKILDAIDAYVLGTADWRQRRILISSGGMERLLESYSITDLTGPNGLRNYYATVVAREQRLAKIRKGRGYFRQIKSRF